MMTATRLAALISLVLAGATLLAIMAMPHAPRLVGYGCIGASGPIYADEEDHLPPCAAIERNEG